MCGIVGILGHPEVSDVDRMLRAIRHRGPEGSFYARIPEAGVLFGFLRLGFTDIISGHQPLFNEDGSMMAVVNGEFYDHEAIREELIRQGHRFSTKSDSELVPHLLEQVGLNLFERLNGEFAFAVWDNREKALILARDRFGIKPLFYAQDPKRGLVFASECKAILALPGFERAIDPLYFSGTGFGSVETRQTAFKGIYSVRPGHYLIYKNGEFSEKAYWTPPLEQAPDVLSYEDARRELRSRLERAVQRRLQAEVPVGVTLSGGLDSCTVAGLASRLSGRKIPAFNVGFVGSEYDESEAAAQIADFHGLDLHKVRLQPNDLVTNFLPATFHTETVGKDLSSAARMLLAQNVRSLGYKAVMSGEGADELFGGYSYFKLEQIWRKTLEGGETERQANDRWQRFMKDEARNEGVLWSRGLPWRKHVAALGAPMHYSVRLAENEGMKKWLLSKAVREAQKGATLWTAVDTEFGIDRLKSLSPFNMARLISRGVFNSYIAPTLGDRMEMSHSLEGRAPFLDSEVLDLAYRLPESFCLDWEGFQEKKLVYDTFSDLVPPALRGTRKHPFSSPRLKESLGTPDGKELFNVLLSTQAIADAGLFAPGFARLLKFAWKIVPSRTLAGTRLDLAIGYMMSLQALHHVFVRELDAYADFSELPHPLTERTAA